MLFLGEQIEQRLTARILVAARHLQPLGIAMAAVPTGLGELPTPAGRVAVISIRTAVCHCGSRVATQ